MDANRPLLPTTTRSTLRVLRRDAASTTMGRSARRFRPRPSRRSSKLHASTDANAVSQGEVHATDVRPSHRDRSLGPQRGFCGDHRRESSRDASIPDHDATSSLNSRRASTGRQTGSALDSHHIVARLHAVDSECAVSCAHRDGRITEDPGIDIMCQGQADSQTADITLRTRNDTRDADGRYRNDLKIDARTLLARGDGDEARGVGRQRIRKTGSGVDEDWARCTRRRGCERPADTLDGRADDDGVRCSRVRHAAGDRHVHEGCGGLTVPID